MENSLGRYNIYHPFINIRWSIFTVVPQLHTKRPLHRILNYPHRGYESCRPMKSNGILAYSTNYFYF